MIKAEQKYTIPKPRGLKIDYKEADILQQCREYLDSREDLFWRRVEGSGKFVAGKFIKSEMKGCPDLFIIYRGDVYLIELKVPGGSLSESQADFIVVATSNGAYCGVCCSLDAVKRFLNHANQDWQVTTKSGDVPIWY